MKEKPLHQEAFNFYYNLGTNRSLKVTAEHFNYSLTTLKKWSREFKWQDRMLQKNKEITEQLNKRNDEDVEEVNSRYRRLAEVLYNLFEKDIMEGKVSRNTIKEMVELYEFEKDLRTDGNVADININFITAKKPAEKNLVKDNGLSKHKKLKKPYEEEEVPAFDPELHLR